METIRWSLYEHFVTSQTTFNLPKHFFLHSLSRLRQFKFAKAFVSPYSVYLSLLRQLSISICSSSLLHICCQGTPPHFNKEGPQHFILQLDVEFWSNYFGRDSLCCILMLTLEVTCCSFCSRHHSDVNTTYSWCKYHNQPCCRVKIKNAVQWIFKFNS